MRRFFLLVGVAAVAIGLVVGFGPPSQLAKAQAPTAPDVRVTLHASTVQFTSLPNSFVTAELLDANGSKGTGLGGTDASGQGAVTFTSGQGGFGPFGGGGGVPVRAGDTIVLSRDGQRPLRLQVPTLSAQVDVGADRVSGVAPAGAQLAMRLTTTGATSTTITRTVTAAADGSYRVDLAGSVDLEPGGVTGSVVYLSAQNYSFTALFAALSAELTLETRAMRGQATPGSQVSATITRPDGTRRTLGPSEVTNSVNYTLGGGGFGGGPGGQGGPPPPLAAGDSIVITNTVQGGAPTVMQATAQAFAVDLNTATDQVHGTGPADVPVVLIAESMDGTRVDQSLRSDSSGAFSAALAGQADLGPGWRVRAAYVAQPGLRVGAVAVVPKLRVGIDVITAQGRAQPGQALTVTLRSASGEVKAQSQPFINDLGDYNVFFGGFGTDPARPTAGDTVELAFVNADPVLLRVPPLTAKVDLAANAIYGTTSAGAQVKALVAGMPASSAAAGQADGQGNYRVAFPPPLDLVRPADGFVSQSLANGNEFYASWAAVQISALLGNTFNTNSVTGNRPSGRPVLAELLTADGKTVATASDDGFGFVVIIGPGGVVGGGDQFFMTLADITGTSVDMQPGDRLRVTAGDDVTELTIPPLDAIVLVPQDTVSGRTAANSRVQIQIASTVTRFEDAVETQSDAAGNFTKSFSGQLDIRYGDFVFISVDHQEHIVQNAFVAPGLYLDLDRALLLGSLQAQVDVAVTAKRGTTVLATAATSTDTTGAFAVLLVDKDGEPLILRPGDVVEAKPSDPAIEVQVLNVPELTVSADAASDAISGRATPGGTLVMLLTEAYFRGSVAISQAWPEIEPAGTYTADLVPHVNVRPGTEAIALYRPASGHYVQRTRIVPILNAEHSGPNVCGFGEPRSTVAASLLDGTNVLARAQSRARTDGYFYGVLADSNEMPVATAAGQTVRADITTPPTEILLPQLDVTVNWDANQVSGTGPANTPYFISPATPCVATDQPFGPNIVFFGGGFAGRTGADGAFQGFIPFAGAPGSGLEIAMYAPNDHRFFRHIYRALGRVFIHTNRVTGQVNPLAPVTLVLRDAAGAEKARATAKANAAGFFEAWFKDAAGGVVASEATDVVELQVATEQPAITVEPLSFDFSPGTSGIQGRAPAGRTVQLYLKLNDGRIYNVTREAAADGTFGFGAEDVPVRATWTLEDVTDIRIVLPTPNGHQIIDQTADFEKPVTGPPGARIFLPIGVKTARLEGRATAAAVPAPLPAVRTATGVEVAPQWPRWVLVERPRRLPLTR